MNRLLYDFLHCSGCELNYNLSSIYQQNTHAEETFSAVSVKLLSLIWLCSLKSGQHVAEIPIWSFDNCTTKCLLLKSFYFSVALCDVLLSFVLKSTRGSLARVGDHVGPRHAGVCGGFSVRQSALTCDSSCTQEKIQGCLFITSC